MTLSELVTAVLLKATGKVTSLTSTDTKYQKVLGIANNYIDIWENTKGVDWSSLYELNHEIGSVTATDTFDLDDDIRKISDTRGDFVQIINGDQITNYNIVPNDSLKRFADGDLVCAQIGRTLVFRTAFPSDSPLIGATITVPVYLSAEHLSGDNDDVPVDIPQWLVLMTAAEYIRNDITKQNQYPNLVGEANELMDKMKEDNDAQVNEAYVAFTPLGRTW